MLKDIFNSPQIATIDGKDYKFEYNHAAYAILENKTQKSAYDFYDLFMSNKEIMIKDALVIVTCAMQKHHKPKDILKFEENLRNYPGLWQEIKEAVISAFIIPLLPPQILKESKLFENSKKKILTKSQEK